MIRTSSTVSWNEPLAPLTAKQLQAAAESHDYALAHDLVLALETDDHLQYHYGVAANEQRRIPAVERSLADDHLPPLVLPSTKIEELWTVPRRVAGVLEAACRWLEDYELTACEEVVANNQSKKTTRSTTERARTLKIERPLLLTNPDEDCAELQRMAEVAVSCGEDCVRKHGLIQSNKEEQDLFAIPTDASDYAAHLEESIRTETMVVSEHSIRSLMSMMASMEWTDKDQSAFLDQQITMPTLVHRYLSPPLPPVNDFEYFVPSGGPCLVSDASDVSSGVSEALEEAERLLTEQTGEAWIDEAVDLDMLPFPGYAFDDSIDNLCSQLPVLQTKKQQERDLSMSLSSISSDSLPQYPPARRTEDDELFNAWINESMLENEDSKYDDEHDAAQAVQRGLGYDLSDDSCQDANYEEFTAESLLALEENEIVVQAKISVPAVGTESSLPSWHEVGENVFEMWQWITNDAKAVFHDLEWTPDQDHDDDRKLNNQLDAMATHYDQLYTETLEVDTQCIEKTAAWIKTRPDIQSMLIDSIRPFVLIRKAVDEEPLDVPEEVPKEAAVGAPKLVLQESNKPLSDSSKSSQKERPIQPRPRQDSNNPWGDLMNRHKKRKMAHNPGSPMPTSTDTPACQPTVQIKAPELVLGFRAFADPPMRADEPGSGQGAEESGAAQSPLMAIQAASIIIEKGSAVQPIQTGISDLPKAILSTAIPRSLRSFLIKLLPSLDFVERDYQQHHAGYDGINTDDEADIVVSPSTGIITSTMVGLRQTDTQKRLVFQSRVAAVAPRYKTLHILIYRNNARPVQDDRGTHDGLPELSPSDAMALAQLQGFVCSLPCKVSASYVGGGEHAVAEWVASLLIQAAKEDGKRRTAENYLVEEETRWEIFLRQAGFNVYDAQIVLGVLGGESGIKRRDDVNERNSVRQLIEMSSEECLHRLGSVVGCQSALAVVRKLFSEKISTGNASF